MRAAVSILWLALLVVAPMGAADPLEEVMEQAEQFLEGDRPCDQDSGARACVHVGITECSAFSYSFDYRFTNALPTEFDSMQADAFYNSPTSSRAIDKEEMTWVVNTHGTYTTGGMNYAMNEGEEVTLTATANLVYPSDDEEPGQVDLNGHAHTEQVWKCIDGEATLQYVCAKIKIDEPCSIL